MVDLQRTKNKLFLTTILFVRSVHALWLSGATKLFGNAIAICATKLILPEQTLTLPLLVRCCIIHIVLSVKAPEG